MPAVITTDGRAARARRTLVAGCVTDIAEVRAARALQEIAAHRRLVADLRARRVQKCLRDQRVLLDDSGMSGEVRHGGGSAEPKALRVRFDAIVEQHCE